MSKNFIVVTSEYCSLENYLSNGVDSCNDGVVLKIPYDEVLKFHSVEISKSELNTFSDSDLTQIWSFAFFSVLTFYCLGLGVGSVLGFLKRELR